MWTFILIAALSVILGISIHYLLVKAPKLKVLFLILLPVLIIALAYRLYYGIEVPIQFEKQKKVRTNEVVQKLKEIRDSQVAFKTVYGKYTASFDTLIGFLKNDSLPMIRAIGSIPDSLEEKGMTEAMALAQGLIIRDTIRVSVRDSLFNEDYPIDSIRYIPYSNGTEFEMEAGTVVTGSKVKVKVFEARAPYVEFLKGLDEQLIINLVEDRKTNDLYEGLKVGDINEPNNNAGNWE